MAAPGACATLVPLSPGTILPAIALQAGCGVSRQVVKRLVITAVVGGLDVLALSILVAAVMIALTGGGSFDVWGQHVRAHSVASLLWFLTLWSLLRYSTLSMPLLLIPGLSPARLSRRAVRIVDAVMFHVDQIDRRAIAIALVVLCTAVTILKIAIAAAHPGFFGGDDVEVHEMTQGALLGLDWPVWDLRSAFYPMTVVYPVQWSSWQFGWSDTAQLVLAGRLPAIVASTVAVAWLYRTGSLRADASTGLAAAFLLATSSLFVEFGASELPRPLAALLILGAYGAVTSAPRIANAAGAGFLIGIAACLRFSEIVFLLPLTAHLAIERRWREAAWALLAMAATMTVVQAATDYVYWGKPFASALSIVQFTLSDRLSSRGYEPWWYYAWHIPSWSDYLTVGLALIASRQHPRLALWVWAPVIVLSGLPHKEPRYLVPVIPLLSLLAAHGFITVAAAVRARSHDAAPALALALLASISLRAIDQASKYHVDRSDSEVGFAAEVAPSLSSAPVVLEQAWRFGGHIYLGRGRQVVDLNPVNLGPDEFAQRIASLSPGLVALSAGACERLRCDTTLVGSGFVEATPPPLVDLRYRVFRR